MHFLVFGPVKTAGDVSVFKYNFFFIDLESLPIVTANFDEYESKSACYPYKGQATGGSLKVNKRGKVLADVDNFSCFIIFL